MPQQILADKLGSRRKAWLVTGVAGFIGSHLLEELLLLNQNVVGVDNFSTGFKANLEDVKTKVSPEAWNSFRFIEGDIRDESCLAEALDGVDIVLHQAALGSVPRSVENPLQTNSVNVEGTLQVFWAARQAGVKRIVYASSSSVYGDSKELPKVEERIGRPLSPYSVSKLTDEHYATVFSSLYNLELLGLRYFNVFGPRQNPEGAYAAVIPRWIAALKEKKKCKIFGDGETSRDFCFVKNVVQANILAGLVESPEAFDKAYNIALSGRTTLRDLHDAIRAEVSEHVDVSGLEPVFEEFRTGDVRHSHADISRAKKLLGYDPQYSLQEGLKTTVAYYMSQ